MNRFAVLGTILSWYAISSLQIYLNKVEMSGKDGTGDRPTFPFPVCRCSFSFLFYDVGKKGRWKCASQIVHFPAHDKRNEGVRENKSNFGVSVF